MEAADIVARDQTETESIQEVPATSPFIIDDEESIWVEPDLGFIRRLRDQTGESFKKCFQCGMCSATCPLSPNQQPFPRKEMAWAVWGMKAQLLRDPDVWVCHQCNDCSTACPRSGRPGDILAAIRQQTILHYSRPRFLARWVQRPAFVPVLLAVPALLLGLALLVRDPIAAALELRLYDPQSIIYPYSSIFPHWLLNGFFTLFVFLSLIAMVAGVAGYWRAIRDGTPRALLAHPSRSLTGSFFAALKRIITHEDFSQCTTRHARLLSHACVFFGFTALTAVTLWVISGGFNPLITSEFVYPFSFWSPWKVLANLGGIALLAGCLLMIRDRLTNQENAGNSTYFDWSLIWAIFAVGATGFITEGLHYLRMVPHRHFAYFIHLVFVFALLIYLPYSKFAHLIYRTVSLVFAEYTGRIPPTSPAEPTSDLAGPETRQSSPDEGLKWLPENTELPV